VTRDLAISSTVDALAAALRPRILEGELEAGARLREQELSDDYGVARHTLRAALRTLAAEGLVKIEPNRGASVASLGAAELHDIADLRIALETEAARLALERGEGHLPAGVHGYAARLAAVCRRKRPPSWSSVVDAHEELHTAIVDASGSARIKGAYRALAGELRLVLVQLRPSWTLERMAQDHLDLVEQIEEQGPDVLRPHIRGATAAIVANLESDLPGGPAQPG
jgi:DNA-binding GntR family transcriptional regulator